MIEGLLDGDVGEFARRGMEKWTPRCSKPYAVDFIAPPAAHGLVDRVVLAVDGEQLLALAARFGGDEVAGGDQALFVSEPDGLTGSDGLVGGFQSGDTDDGADYEVSVRVSRDLHSSSSAVSDVDVAKPSLLQLVVELVSRFDGCHREKLRTPAACLLEGEIDVVARCHADDGEAVRKPPPTMLRVLLPMEPVEPRMAMRFMPRFGWSTPSGMHRNDCIVARL